MPSNPFYIDPTGGRDVAGSIAGLGQSLAGFGELQRQREAEQKQIEQQKALSERINAGKAAIQGAMNDPSKMAQVMIEFPELQKTAEKAFGFANEATKPIVNKVYSQVLADSDNAVQYLTEGIQLVQQSGGNPQNMIKDLQAIQQDPIAGLKQVEMGVAVVAPELHKAYQEQQKANAPHDQVPFQKGEGALVFNPNTNEYTVDPVASAYLQEQAINKAVKGVELDAKERQGINKDVTNLVKDTKLIYSAAKSLAALKETSSPTDQLAAIFKFMKALDPTSVVREGEQQMARSTGGPADAFIGYVNKISGEGGLPPEAFANMVNTAESMSNSASDTATDELNSYLDAYEDTIPDSFKEKLKGRVPRLKKKARSDADILAEYGV